MIGPFADLVRRGIFAHCPDFCARITCRERSWDG
ncbi:MAG: hypothetical protein ACI9MU_001593, partial [Alphaproteobacteria bacterium]